MLKLAVRNFQEECHEFSKITPLFILFLSVTTIAFGNIEVHNKTHLKNLQMSYHYTNSCKGEFDEWQGSSQYYCDTDNGIILLTQSQQTTNYQRNNVILSKLSRGDFKSVSIDIGTNLNTSMQTIDPSCSLIFSQQDDVIITIIHDLLSRHVVCQITPLNG